jgi:ABC-type multidrug transport system fused ATPase/permease subunit
VSRTDAPGLRRGLSVLGVGIRQAPRPFIVAVTGSTLYGVMTAGQAYVLGIVVSRVVQPAFETRHVTGSQLAEAGGWMSLVTVLLVIGVVGRRVAAGVVMFDLGAMYRRLVTRQYLRLPLAWHQRHPAGQLLSNANADVEATWNVFAPLPMGLGVIVMLVVAAVAMVLADPVLALIGLCVFPALVFINGAFQRRMSPRVTRAQQLRADVSAVAHESFDGALVVKALGREEQETARFATVSGRLRDANVAVGRTRGTFDPVIEALPTLGTLAVLVAGTARVRSGAIDAAAVVQVAYLFSLLAFPVRSLGWVLGELPRAVVGWDRVNAVLRAEGELPYGDQVWPDTGSAALSLRDVEYAYADTDGSPLPVLHGVDLEVPAGRTLALVGPTGSGKSTLTTLLVRLVDPASGVVELDGVDLREGARGQVAAHAALVPQQTFLFDDTVRGNITLGDPAIEEHGDERVWEALRLAQIDGFVAGLPAGLDTTVGERGTTLSGGQRQRIALARAVVRRPRLLVLDDATSAVDTTVEAAILAGLRPNGSARSGLRTGGAAAPTVVVVAYRKATIALADEVAYIEHGRVVDRGTHGELLARNEGYRTLVDAYEREAAERAAVAADEEVRS